jgi:hypothetical protein
MYPDRYRPRQPGTFSVDAVKQLLVTLAARLADQAANDDERQRVLSTIAQVGKEIIVNTQPFIEQAMTLLSELSTLSDNVPESPLIDTSSSPASEEPEAIAPNQENNDEQ